jgi:hypothetical protein
MPMTSAQLIETDQRQWTVRWSYFGALISILIAVIGFFQTQFFVSLSSRPDNESVRREIAAAELIQRQLSIAYSKQTGTALTRGIQIDNRFGDLAGNQVRRTIDNFFNDAILQTEIQKSFGVSLRDLNAVVTPAWSLTTQEDLTSLGLTTQGGKIAIVARGDSRVGGFTLRDKDSAQAVTLDGIPRIFLNLSAFESQRTLRFTLFHELMHAINVPGHRPFFLTFAQDDLTYLPEYRSYVARENLTGYGELKIWVFAIMIPLVIATTLGFRVLKRRSALFRKRKVAKRY